MKIKQFFTIAVLALFILLVIVQCNTKTENETAVSGNITPVDLPVITPGFSFPEDSNKIYQWINNTYDSASVYKHAWGIWAGLTAQSGQVYQGDSLLVYQTWLGIDEVQNLVKNELTGTKDLEKKLNRTILRVPNQFLHAGKINTDKVKVQDVGGFHLNMIERKASLKNQVVPDNAELSWVAVAYDPAAVKHVVSNSLLNSEVIAKYKKTNAIGAIPAFPNNAITIKPTYYVGRTSDTLIQIPAWQGVPPSMIFPDADSINNSYIFVDVLNRQVPGKKLTPVKGGQQPNAGATCNLSDFISFKLDSTMAQYINTQQGIGAKANDLALLVAMHVTTKEIDNWTWQSFYWDPNPQSPNSPSSPLAASLKQPLGIKGPAAHYSLTTSYVMVLPNQPVAGGTNKNVSPMIGYNPYLEGSFGPSTFSLPNKMNSTFKYGVQTNCASCHALATSDDALGYTTDQYIDMRDTMFNNKVQLDFSWSVQFAIFNPDTIKTLKQK